MRWSRTSSLRVSLRHLQTFLAPDLFHPLVIHSPAFPLQQSRYPRAQKFPEAASFRMALSRACSATSFFNRAFSFSSNSFSPLAWGHTKTAAFPAPPVIGLLGDPQRLADLSHPLPIGQLHLGLAKLVDDLLGCETLPTHHCPLSRSIQSENRAKILTPKLDPFQRGRSVFKMFPQGFCCYNPARDSRTSRRDA